MRIFRSFEDQVALFNHVDETGIAQYHVGNEIHDAAQHQMKRVGRGDALANFV